MCFSTVASFGASVILLAGGVAAVKKTSSPLQIPFAVIPFIFSFQQFTEGMLWLSLTNPSYAKLHDISTYTFLILAQVVWPTWAPFSIWRLEKNAGRKKMLTIILGIGIVVSLYLLYSLLVYKANSVISVHHIRYELNFPHWVRLVIGSLYLIPTIMSPFVSSVKRMWILGLLILISFIVTKFFFEEYIVSIWCYFAAAISIMVLVIIAEVKPLALRWR